MNYADGDLFLVVVEVDVQSCDVSTAQCYPAEWVREQPWQAALPMAEEVMRLLNGRLSEIDPAIARSMPGKVQRWIADMGA